MKLKVASNMMKIVALVCLQALLFDVAIGLPNILGSNLNTLNSGITTNVVPSSVLSGSAAQVVLPGYSPNWPEAAQAVPLLTEILPSLQFGEMSVDGEMPVGGMIKITGSFPVYGSVAVDGTVPSRGTAYVDTANVLRNECSCV